MKKLVLIFFLLLALCGCQNHSERELADYCLNINEEIKSCDFSFAKVNEGKIELYDDNMALVSEIEFAEYNSDIKILFIKKYDNKILFSTCASLDDSSGFMIVNDDSLILSEAFDGIAKIEKFDGKVYYYDTAH